MNVHLKPAVDGGTSKMVSSDIEVHHAVLEEQLKAKADNDAGRHHT